MRLWRAPKQKPSPLPLEPPPPRRGKRFEARNGARRPAGSVSRLETAPAVPREAFRGSKRRPPSRGRRFEPGNGHTGTMPNLRASSFSLARLGVRRDGHRSVGSLMCPVERFGLRPGPSADHPALDRSTKFIGGMFDRYPARNRIAQRSKRATPRPPVGVESLFEFGTTDAVTWDRGCANPVARKRDLRHFAEMLAARIKRILPTARAVPPSPASLAFLAKHGVSSKIVRALCHLRFGENDSVRKDLDRVILRPPQDQQEAESGRSRARVPRDWRGTHRRPCRARVGRRESGLSVALSSLGGPPFRMRRIFGRGRTLRTRARDVSDPGGGETRLPSRLLRRGRPTKGRPTIRATLLLEGADLTLQPAPGAGGRCPRHGGNNRDVL
jgi:hypothetical protein